MHNTDTILANLAQKSPQHIRELARNTDLNPNTILNITAQLEAEGILTRSKDDDTKRVYVSYSQKLLAKNRRRMYTVERILQSGLVDALTDHFAYPTVFLFGSMAKGENHAQSDIDLFIISDEKKAFDTAKFEKRLGQEIQLFVHTPKEFRALRKSSKELVNNVLNGIKLTGYIEVF